MLTVGTGIWPENYNTWKMRETHSRTWYIEKKHTEKRGEREMHTVGLGIWRENWKSWKMRNTHCRRWNVLKTTVKREKWEMHTIWVWNMLRKMKI
jgi:hypothetical protein